ncbi:MAG: hypothetical protein WKG07_44145 [Hymenobacter sp.]
MTRTHRLLGMLTVLSLSLAACGTSTKPGSTNVEDGAFKQSTAPGIEGTANGDSLASGLLRSAKPQTTGKEIYKNTDKASDANHDGIAD